MDGYLLDNNHLSAAVVRVSPLRDRMDAARRTGVRLGTCIPVLCELEAGIQQTTRPASCYRHLHRLLEYVRLWPIDQRIARSYGEIFLDLERRGRMLSFVDILLAALCRKMNLTLLTTDRDFEALPDIRTENWLSS
jgi:tRNA(fMet)-specific endonuclease VapC